ncbi:hypothetical protein GHT06_021825 [Daphnia sinensis]|uniref:Bromo domain-containing protein n=1 Tax=Daphnia sinensis TaxID=1820382 RepID=A0AAD5PM08_9CRUS|nr:hypothetical protein GHT06_021825 [Daphnia sinensis]
MMAKKSKKMDMKCFQPSDWLSSTELRRLPFYPQIGDEIIYFRQGHELYVNIVKQKKLYEVNPSSLPWSKQKIHQQELVRIICVTYEVEPPRLVCLELSRLEPRSGALARKTFVVKYHDIEEVPDFLVLKQEYDAAITREWNSSQRFRSLMNDNRGIQMWWEGQFIKREPFNPKFPESMFLCYIIRWDNGDLDRLSPWDLENIDPKRKPCSVGAGVRVLPIEIIRTSYMPGKSDWPPLGDRDSESDRISTGISQIMDLDVAQHFSAPVDLDEFPTYASIVKYPIDLLTIKARLDQRFYRRVAAIEHDIRRIHTNALLFNDPKKSDIVRNACITTDMCLEIVRNADVDLTVLCRQYLEGCNMKGTPGKSSETSNPKQGSSLPLPRGSSLKGLDKIQQKTKCSTEETSLAFTLTDVVAGSIQTRTPTRIQGQKITPKMNHVVKEHRSFKASSVMSEGHISPKFPSCINANGPNTEIGLEMDGHKLDEYSELENIRDKITSPTKEKVIHPEEAKIESSTKPKQVASISPYTFPRSEKSKDVNLEKEDLHTRVDQSPQPMIKTVSRRSRLPIHELTGDNFDAILFPEPTSSSISTVPTSERSGSNMLDRPKESSDIYIIEETCHQNSEITFTKGVGKQSIGSDDVKIEYLAKRRRISMAETDPTLHSDESEARNQEDNCMFACRAQHMLTTMKSATRKSRSPSHQVKNDNLSNPLVEFTHLPRTKVSPTSQAGTEALVSHKHRLSDHQRLSNNRVNFTKVREKEQDSSIIFENASITSIPVPIAVSTPIGRHKKNEELNTSIELRKPRLRKRNGTNDEISEQSACGTHSSRNRSDIKNKRKLSSSGKWNISFSEHVAQETSGTKSPKKENQSSQSSLPNELPAREMVAINLHPQSNSSSRKAEEALEIAGGTPASIQRSAEDQIVSLTSEKSFSVMNDAPPPAESEHVDSRGANCQPESCNTSIFNENRNQAADISDFKGNLPFEGQDQSLKQKVKPTSSNVFCTPFCEQFKVPDSLLKKTLKKEHRAKLLTKETKCGSKKDDLCEISSDNRSGTTGSKGRSTRSRTKDSLVAKILAESKIDIPMENVTSGKSEIKPRKDKVPVVSVASKTKKIREEPINVSVSIEEIMKKYLGSESCDEQPMEPKKGKKKRPLDPKEKRADNSISKEATSSKDNVENVGDASNNVATSGKTRKTARKRKNASISEQLNLVDRILRERK